MAANGKSGKSGKKAKSKSKSKSSKSKSSKTREIEETTPKKLESTMAEAVTSLTVDGKPVPVQEKPEEGEIPADDAPNANANNSDGQKTGDEDEDTSTSGTNSDSKKSTKEDTKTGTDEDDSEEENEWSEEEDTSKKPEDGAESKSDGQKADVANNGNESTDAKKTKDNVNSTASTSNAADGGNGTIPKRHPGRAEKALLDRMNLNKKMRESLQLAAGVRLKGAAEDVSHFREILAKLSDTPMSRLVYEPMTPSEPGATTSLLTDNFTEDETEVMIDQANSAINAETLKNLDDVTTEAGKRHALKSALTHIMEKSFAEKVQRRINNDTTHHYGAHAKMYDGVIFLLVIIELTQGVVFKATRKLKKEFAEAIRMKKPKAKDVENILDDTIRIQQKLNKLGYTSFEHCADVMKRLSKVEGASAPWLVALSTYRKKWDNQEIEDTAMETLEYLEQMWKENYDESDDEDSVDDKSTIALLSETSDFVKSQGDEIQQLKAQIAKMKANKASMQQQPSHSAAARTGPRYTPPPFLNAKPTDLSEVKKHGNKDWYWCDKCAKWVCTHKTSTHKDDWKPAAKGGKKRPYNSNDWNNNKKAQKLMAKLAEHAGTGSK